MTTTTTARYAPIRNVKVRADYRWPILEAVVTLADDLEHDDRLVLLNESGEVVGWEQYETGAFYTNDLFRGTKGINGTTELLLYGSQAYKNRFPTDR